MTTNNIVIGIILALFIGAAIFGYNKYAKLFKSSKDIKYGT